MIRFSKARYFSLTGSLIAIIALYVLTFEEHGGFARSMDFDGGVQLEVEFSKGVEAGQVRDFFSSLKPPIDGTVTRFTDSQRNIYKIEAGAGIIEKLEGTDKAAAGADESVWDYILSFFVKKDLKADAKVSADKAEGAKQATGTDALAVIKDMVKKQWDPALGKYEEFAWVDTAKVGPSFGISLRQNAVKLLLVTMFFIIIYLTVRFEFRFGVAALMALLHDLLVVWGLVGILQIKPSVPLIAALLTILGYSINDTIVIFDRIRENLRGNEKGSIKAVVDESVNQSLSRTLVTSLSTMMAVLCLYFLGGEALEDFSFVLILGILIGTYSSIFVASAILVIWERLRGTMKQTETSS